MFTDLFLECACWLDTMISHEEYLASAVDPSPVTSLPGFEHSRALKDVMHGVNLGVAQHVAGNIMYEDSGTQTWDILAIGL